MTRNFLFFPSASFDWTRTHQTWELRQSFWVREANEFFFFCWPPQHQRNVRRYSRRAGTVKVLLVLCGEACDHLPTHARPVQMQTFLQRCPPKKGSTNIACEGRRRNLFYLFNPCLHSFHVQESKKTRKKWKQFLSQFCYCLQNNIYEEEIFISSEAAFFIFCLAFRSSPIPEPKKLSCLLRRKTNFLKNIYSAQASIHTLYICVIVVLFRQYIRRFFCSVGGGSEREKGRES